MLSGLFDFKTARFGLSITGLPTIETTISDTLKVAKNIYVILFSALLGLTVGAFTSSALYINNHVWQLPIIYFPFAPVFINFLSNYTAAIYINIVLKFRSGNITQNIPSVKTILSVFFPCFLLWIIFLYLQKSIGSELNLNFITLFSIPMLYVSLSEAVHFVIYRYIIHDIEQEEYPSRKIFGSQGASADQPEESDEAQIIEPPCARVSIGTRIFDAADIFMVEAQGNYLRVITTYGEFTERCQMSTAVEALGQNLGLQVHRSFWISFSAISGLIRSDGDFYVRLTIGSHIKVARPRQRHVREILAERGLMAFSSCS